MTRKASALVLTVLASLAASTPAALLAQCAMCRESVAAERGTGQGDLALGFNCGILFMLGTLILLMGGVMGLFVYGSRGVAVPRAEIAAEPAPSAEAGKPASE